MALAAVLAAIGLLIGTAAAAAQGVSPDPTLPNEPLKPVSYEVVPGDTLLGIAHSFGITPETILWANGMSSGDLLRIGQKLTILPVSGVLHQLKAGESVLSIAATYGVEAGKIVEANQISDPSLVHEGDLLIVPGGVKKATRGAPPSRSGGGNPIGYTVKPGDTLSSIAATYGVQLSALQSANGLGDGDLLGIGQQLSIPGGQQPAPAAPHAGQEAAQDRESSSRGDQKDGQSFIANVTAYTILGRTATGTRTRWGTVAVDPRVIPLGSKIRVDGFEETFVAEDTGGGVRGNWIDIWFPDYGDALRFGIQSRRVTIVEP
ncbi:MAG: LysM peptidoglycan-binding domain-containing protein [Chloroflexi bacterium]|nr:LysM peptidoglycan-binding domain-containing protein [Chloroflexota bacterium]